MLLGCLLVTLVSLGAVAQSAKLEDVRQLVREQKYDQALVRLDDHLRESPQDPEGRFMRGVVLAEQDQADAAIDVFKDLTRDYPELPEPHNNLAVLLASKGDYAGARDALLVAINTHPSYATAHENLGDIYAKMAGIAYGKALQLNVGNESAKTKLALAREIVSTKMMPGTTPDPMISVTEPPPPPESAETQVAAAESSTAETAAASNGPAEKSQAQQEAPVVESQPVVENEAEATLANDAVPEAAALSAEEAVLQQGSSGSVQEEILSTLYAWASAWSNQDTEGYLSYYDEQYSPSRGQTREEWETQRRQRLQAPSFIEVNIDDAQVDLRGVDRARVRFVQAYRSDSYEDRVSKLISVVWDGSEWKIVSERTVN